MSKQIKHEGTLHLLGDQNIPCYVLDDGMRVLSGNQMQEALKLFPDPNSVKSGSRLARLLGYKALEPLIINRYELGHFEHIECYKGNLKINGFEATVLVDICDIMLEARRQNIKLTANQQVIAKQCEILIRSFAKVGIIALIDEATGYQYEREKNELEVILKALVSDEILEYQQQFQLSFYREIFRLWNIPFTAEYIKRKPQFIGHLTNKYIYSNLPKGTVVLEKLKENTPKTKGGYWKYKLHQSLTKDKGRESLKKVLYSVEALASVSKDKRDFDRLINEKYGQKELPFPEMDDQLKTLPEENKPPKEEDDLSDFNKKLNQALNYNPKDKEKDKEDDKKDGNNNETENNDDKKPL